MVCEWNTIAQVLTENYKNFRRNRASFWNSWRLVIKRADGKRTGIKRLVWTHNAVLIAESYPLPYLLLMYYLQLQVWWQFLEGRSFPSSSAHQQAFQLFFLPPGFSKASLSQPLQTCSWTCGPEGISQPNRCIISMTRGSEEVRRSAQG